MVADEIKIIHRGDSNGNGWITRIQLSSGIEIFGLATENVYGGDWDLGPTWNYVVRAENPFLVDTGRYGMADRLLEMIGQAGLPIHDLKGITLSHGHEDHDGGLADLVLKTGIPAWVHSIYRRLSRCYPDQAPHPSKKSFSASCWHCPMPEVFTQAHCRDYHRKKNDLAVGLAESSQPRFDSAITLHHLPGHSPDSMAFQVGTQALLVGDNILPEITPHPSQEAYFGWTESILPPEFDRPEKVYGLRAYLRSLKRLQGLGRQYPEMLVLQAHRLFHDGRWRIIDLEKRSAETVEHHLQRCASILAFLQEKGSCAINEIVLGHFEPRLLKGLGFRMAESEIKSHLELLEHSGDVEWERPPGRVKATGTARFEQYINTIPPA